MRGIWIVGAMALVVTLVTGARWAGYPDQSSDKQERKPAAKIDPARGFTEREKQIVAALNNFIVEALNDLDPTRGTERVRLNPDGSYTKYMEEARFGMSRVDTPVAFQHDDVVFVGTPLRQIEVIDTPDGKRFERAHYVPHVVVSADGLPLTADSISIDWRGRGEKLDREDELLAAIRKKVAIANLGEDFGFEIPGFEGWAKPLKLTKKRMPQLSSRHERRRYSSDLRFLVA